MSNDRRVLFACIEIMNTLDSTDIAFQVWTAAKEGCTITPECGFIAAQRKTRVLIAYEAARVKDLNNPEFALFFVRGLPLKEGFLTYEMKQSVDRVFHAYNRSILFTVATLNAFLNLEFYAEQVPNV